MGGAWDNPHYKPVTPERAIWGTIGSKHYGIPRIMDILENNGLRGTFFVEVLAGLNGYRSDLGKAYAQVLQRGHDAQLHLHPIHYYYRMIQEGRLSPEQLPADKDMIGNMPLQIQTELLQKGVGMFQEMVGKPPLAFRAGNFGASASTLTILEKLGIQFDSSFNACYVGAACSIDSRGLINEPWRHNGLWEIPVTSFETGFRGLRSLKPLNINAVSFWEMKQVLEQAERIGLSAVTFIAHSFSLLKTRDIQFVRRRVDRIVLRRFEALCRFLRENRDRFSVIGFSDIEPSLFKGRENGVPKMGALGPAMRKAVQAVNRLYWV
jgi:hypothetical protein